MKYGIPEYPSIEHITHRIKIRIMTSRPCCICVCGSFVMVVWYGCWIWWKKRRRQKNWRKATHSFKLGIGHLISTRKPFLSHQLLLVLFFFSILFSMFIFGIVQNEENEILSTIVPNRFVTLHTSHFLRASFFNSFHFPSSPSCWTFSQNFLSEMS